MITARLAVNKRFAAFALAFALLGGASIWLLTRIEFEPRRSWTGYQGEARRNSWLAAERLLDRMGMEVHHMRAVPELHDLPQRATLVLTAPREVLSANDRERILAWVANGGHLVVEAEALDDPDPLLDELEVERKPAKDRKGSGEPFVFTLPQAREPIKAQLYARLSLSAPQATAGVRNSSATLLVHFPRLKGQVTALSSLSFARNSSIGDFSHAELLWQIMRFAPGSRTVYFFDGPRKLSLLEWLRDEAWPALAGIVLLLALWLWRVVPRFGPLAPDPEPARRRLLDHLRASARFLWSRGGGDALAEASREAVLRRIARAQPDFAALPQTERVKRLAALGVTEAEARFVLEPHRALRPDVFAGLIGLYQHIHKQLTHRNGKDRQ